jgi:hypothetical protein
MVRLVSILVYFISLAITLLCGIAAIVISAAIVTGKLADPGAWETAVAIAVVGCLYWLLSRAARGQTEHD